MSWEQIAELGELTVYDRTSAELVDERIEGAEIVYTNKTVLTEAHMAKAGRLKYIGVLATGYNVVDVKAAAKYGIVVTNIPTYGTDSVAQFTMALLLELCHHVGAHADAVKDGAWSRCSDFCFWNYPLVELSKKTMGIIGYGKIGQAVGRIAEAFGMNVLAYSRHQNAGEAVTEKTRRASLEEIFTESDVISLHCPLTEENQGLINSENIAKMKDGVFIVNTARGPLICEEDLSEALKSGKVKGAAVDVLTKEPPVVPGPLADAPNVIITPHIAWAPKEARQRLMDVAAENLRSFLDGKPVNVVS